MTRLVSIHTIVINDPDKEAFFTGEYYKNGEPKMGKASITVAPASFFEMEDPVEVERLLRIGAARMPFDDELGNGGIRTDYFAPPENEHLREL